MKRIVNLLIAAWVFVGLGLHAQTCLPDDVAYRVKSEGFANSQIEDLAQFMTDELGSRLAASQMKL